MKITKALTLLLLAGKISFVANFVLSKEMYYFQGWGKYLQPWEAISNCKQKGGLYNGKLFL